MTAAPDPKRWEALALVCVAFFMTVLDVSIVNVALPSIKRSLTVSDSTLQWVLIAYTITFGGFLTQYLGWEWIFFVNVPVGALVLALTRPFVRESRAEGMRSFDAGGAITVTSGLALLVYAISKAPDVGWATGRTIGLLVGSA